MKKMFFTIALVFLTLYAGMLLAIFFLQDRLLYFPFSRIETTLESAGLEFENVRFRSSDGESISGWWIPAKNDRAALLYCHGNAGNISHRLGPIGVFNGLGLSVLIFDYRGYGESTGRPSEKGTYLDAEAA